MKHILIIRLSSLGDILMASGILPPLKKRYPDAHIHWLVQSEFEEIVRASPFIDHTIIWHRKKWLQQIKKAVVQVMREGPKLLSRLREYPYDLILELQGIWKGSIWALYARGGRKIVVDPKENTHLLFKERVASTGKKILGEEYRELLSYLGIKGEEYYMGIEPPPYIQKRVDGLFKRYRISGPYVALCPFTTREQKHWIDHYWKELAGYIISLGIKVVVLGAEGDRERAEKVFPRHRDIILLTGATSIVEALAVIRRAKCVVGVDTGLTHGAMLYKIPTIAIFGSTCPYLSTGYEKGVVLYEVLSCSPCKRNPTCRGEMICMKKISPERVIWAFNKIVGQSQG